LLNPKEQGDKAKWLKKFLESASRVGDPALIMEHIARREKLIYDLGGFPVRMKTAGRFVTGLGYRHQMENGFAWHAVLGTPYLPGSGLKGLARAYATLCGAKDEDITQIFGPHGDKMEPQAGSVIFLEAIPRQPVTLVAEVMTPHYGPYYQGDGKEPPADYHDPNPIPFLAVEKGVPFLAGVLPRTPSDKDDAKKALEWLGEALEALGAGAKTATGYGRFDVEYDAAPKVQNAVVAPTRKPAEPIKAPEPTELPAFFQVEFVAFGDARKARKKALERKKDGEEAKFREFDLRPTDPTLVKLAGKLVCSARDTEGFDLPFENAKENAGVPRPFYVERFEEHDGKKVARVILLTPPVTPGKTPA
jgi:CRISPR-associated protein Cmr6